MAKIKRRLIAWFFIIAVGVGIGTSTGFHSFLQHSKAHHLHTQERCPEAGEDSSPHVENGTGERDLLDTMDPCLSHGDCSDSGLLAAECQEQILDSALLHMTTRDFDTALEEFSAVDDPELTGLYQQFCEDRLLNNDMKDQDLILTSGNLMEGFNEASAHGKLYKYQYDYSKADCAYIYVPTTVDADTKFICYFPGGNGERTLSAKTMYGYAEGFDPNAILVFHGSSGTTNISRTCAKMIDITTQVAAEAGIAVDYLVVAGHSNGGYTALHCAEQWYSVGHVAAKAVITLDTGEDWTLRAWRLSAQEQERLAEAGTTLYLFEQNGTALNYRPILEMVDNGCRTVIVHCIHGGHKRIMLRAFENGVFSWVIGETELPAGEYTLVPMDDPA